MPAGAEEMDWSGFYVGVMAGYNSTDSQSAYVNAPLTAFTIPSTQQGAVGGVSIGANFQTGVVVLGAEATAAIGGVSATFANPTGMVDDVTTGSDFQALLLGRAGIGVGNVLPYLTAGLAVAHAYSTTVSGANADGMFGGVAYGVGLEVALDDNWSVKGQYLRTNLSGANFHSGKLWETRSAPSSDTFMVGVNFRFK